MFPGMNPRAMKQAMKKMGIQQEELDAYEVVIKTPGKDIVITEPQVSIVKMMGQESFQISGKVTEREKGEGGGIEISEEDIETVMKQASVTREKAIAALEETRGDLAEAILKLQEGAE